MRLGALPSFGCELPLEVLVSVVWLDVAQHVCVCIYEVTVHAYTFDTFSSRLDECILREVSL